MKSGVVLIVLVAVAFLNDCEGNENFPSRYCADPQCSSPISRVRGLHAFFSNDNEKLSFESRQEFDIYGKLVGDKSNLWIAEINGRKGYVPKKSVKELNVFQEDLTFVPSTPPEIPVQNNGNVVKSEEVVEEAIISDKELSSTDGYEVIDGTTIPAEPFITATPTGTFDAQEETKNVPIESTSSFYTNTLSNIKSEMSSISPTTMMTKPEETDDIDKGPSESQDYSMVDTTSRSSDFKGDESESSESKKDNIEADVVTEIDSDEDEDEGEEEADNEDDENEDEAEEEEEEEEISDKEPDEGIENLGDADERSGHERQEMSVQTEKTQEVVETKFSVRTKLDDSINNSDAGDSSSQNVIGNLKEMEKSSEVNYSSSESILTEQSMNLDSDVKATEGKRQHLGFSQTSPYFLPTSESSSVSELGGGGHESPNSLENGSTKVFENSDLKPAADTNLEREMSKESSGNRDQHEKEPLIIGQIVDQDFERGIISQSGLEKDDVTISEENTVHQDVHSVQKDESQTFKPPLVSIEAEHILDNSEFKAKVEVEEESSVEAVKMTYLESTTVLPLDEEITESSIEISTPPISATYEQGTSKESLEQENGVLGITEANPVIFKEDLESEMVTDNLEPKKTEDEMKNVDKAVDTSSGENNLSMSEGTSGIFSIIFLPFSSGYDYLIDTVFGKSDEVEMITESVSNMELVESTDLSDKIVKQLENQEGPQDVEEHKGISSNDQCLANPDDSYCGKSNWPLEADRSSEFEESKSWMVRAREEYQNPFDINNPSYYGALLFSTAVGGMLVCFFLGKYYMEGKKSDALLVAKLNALEKKLMVSSTECLILKDKLRNADDSSEMVESLRSEVNKLQNEKAQLEKELEVAAEAGLEMDRMVSQCLSSQQARESLMESIEQLRLQANQQQAKTSSLENNLVLKTQENETLAQELKLAEEKIAELSSQLRKVEADFIRKEDENHEKYDELRKLYDSQKKQYEEDLRNKTVEAVLALTKCNTLETTLNETKDLLAVRENEIIVLQECLEKIKSTNGNDRVAIEFQDMLDFGKLKAELTSVSKERDHLKEELQGEEEARKLLEDHVKVIKEEVEKLRKSHEEAEREKAEAQTRLEVLSSYFKEKESQLQKELGAQIQKYTDASSVVQHMKSLEEEVDNYSPELNHSSQQIIDLMNEEPTLELIDVTSENEGSQNEALKNEILDQERGYKSQLATIEKKARENWLAARQAERKLEESKQEAGQLRNRLTMLSKTAPQSVSQNGDDSKQNISVMDSNGELSASPLHMGLASNSSVDSLFLDPNSSPPLVSGGVRLPPLIPPPFPPLPPLPPMSPYHHPISPPLPFVPPPPEGIYPQSVDGHRPPPLGRMSSPPPPPSPSHSPHLHHANSRPGNYASPFQDRKGERNSASPPNDMYRGMPIDDRGHMDEWGRYRTPPPHSAHLPDYPPFPYPHPRQHWEESMPPTSSFRPLPSQAEAVREKKGGKSKDNHPTEMETLEKSNRYGGKQ